MNAIFETLSGAGLTVAVAIPCHNEEATVAEVVRRFQAALPEAEIYVYDNASTDGTVAAALEAGAIVRSEPHKGKGNVVRRMFADLEADIWVLVDGDNTYEAEAAPRMISQMVEQQLDMVTGRRQSQAAGSYRPGHVFGNKLLTGVVACLFGRNVTDMLSGYRIMSRRFVKSFPMASRGFEVETELTVHALQMRVPMDEVPTLYGERPAGSTSKLSTWRDGVRILRTISRLFIEQKPLTAFGLMSLVSLALCLGLGLPVVGEFLRTGLVPRFPTAILAAALGIISIMTFGMGILLEAEVRSIREIKRLSYLGIPALKVPRRKHLHRGPRPVSSARLALAARER